MNDRVLVPHVVPAAQELAELLLTEVLGAMDQEGDGRRTAFRVRIERGLQCPLLLVAPNAP